MTSREFLTSTRPFISTELCTQINVFRKKTREMGPAQITPSALPRLFALVKENVGTTRIVVMGDQPPAVDVQYRVRPIEPIERGPRMVRPYPGPAPYPGESFEDIFERGRPGPYFGPRYLDDVR